MASYETPTYLAVRRYYQDCLARGMVLVCHLCGGGITQGGGTPPRGRGRGRGKGGGTLQVDHRVGRVEGGSLHDASNLAPAHAYCNQVKGQRSMITRLTARGNSKRRARHRSPHFPKRVT